MKANAIVRGALPELCALVVMLAATVAAIAASLLTLSTSAGGSRGSSAPPTECGLECIGAAIERPADEGARGSLTLHP